MICSNLIQTLLSQDRTAEAVTALRRHVDRTDSLPALALLAWMLATSSDDEVRDGHDAVAFAERLCQRAGHQDPEALKVLAAAYAEAGRFTQAVERAELALRLAREADLSGLVADLTTQIELYRRGRPVRAPQVPRPLPPASPRPVPPG